MEFGNKQGEDTAMNGRSRIHHFEGASGSTHKIIYICIATSKLKPQNHDDSWHHIFAKQAKQF